VAKQLKITLIKSTIGVKPLHSKNVKALGLKKLNQTVEHPDNSQIRGMVEKVKHLVEVEEI